jgi:FecR protein
MDWLKQRGCFVLPVATVLVATLSVANQAYCAAAPDEARVTRIVHDVKLLPAGAKAKPAAINDEVNPDTGVRTGDRSRSELTFVDLTIERLGANTVFHFNNAGRTVELDSGSMLLRVPKNSGGAQMQTRAVTVGISGTTVILETTSTGQNKLIVLEGSARLGLKRYPRESVNVRGGQMEDVPAGATKLPPPVNINLSDVMQHHPLITDFGPLPSKNLIDDTMNDQPVTGQPVAGSGPIIVPPIIGNIVGGSGIVIGPGSGGKGSHGRQPHNPNRKPGGKTGVGNSNPNRDVGPTTNAAGKPAPTPTPSRKKKKTG